MAFRIRGGIHPAYNKVTAHSPIEVLPAPAELVIPLSQHIGAPCEPLVAVGDRVLLGQKIGDSQSPVSAPIHSTVSGTVKAIEPRWVPTGLRAPCIVIENDFHDEKDPSYLDREDEYSLDRMTPEIICSRAREAGIAGMGGAGFPLHYKLSSGLGKVRHVIINGAECEPYITADHRAMLEYPHLIIGGIRLIMKCYGLDTATVGIEKNKPDAIDVIRAKGADFGIRVEPLPTKYPMGGEKQIIKAISNVEIPGGKLPADYGFAVFNVDTCASLYRAVAKQKPLMKRVVTVSGANVATPKNLLVRIGTPYRALFDACGGFKKEPFKIVSGGPMMGNAQISLDLPVVKNTSALLAYYGGEESFVDDPVCIRCGKCASVCPMHLMPLYIHMYSEKEEFEQCRKLNVGDCIECGSCAYGCPAKIQLVQSIRLAKGKLQAADRAKKAVQTKEDKK